MALRVLFIGSGITAAVTSALLRQKCLQDVCVVVWDKARGAGGRMSTSRSPHDSNCLADLGAQYITTLPENMIKHLHIYSSLLDNGLLEPLIANVEGIKEFPSGTNHFVAPQGMSSLAKHFLSVGADEMHFGKHVVSIDRRASRWEVAVQNGDKEQFDVVVLTMPVPQIAQLTGTVQDVISESPNVTKNLTDTKYSSRYAMALYYDQSVDVSWDVKYLNSPIFRYVAVDNKKRNRPSQLSAIVLHTSIAYGHENVDRSIPDVQEELMKEVEALFPDLPPAAAVKCHKWRYSQVLEAYCGKAGFLALSQSPLLIAGGDGFVASGFDGCITSAMALSEQVARSIELGKNRLNCSEQES